VSTHAPLWQRAAFFMHGSTKQLTFGPLPRHLGSPSFLASTRQAQGASWQ